MILRTVRLDEDDKKILKVLLQRQSPMAPRRTAWEIYEELDLGQGGYAIAPSTEVRQGVQKAIRRKLVP